MNALQKALHAAALEIPELKLEPSMRRYHRVARDMFGSKYPVYARQHPEARPIDVLKRSLWRVELYLRRNRIDWTKWDWEKLVQWLKDHWFDILKVLLTLLMLLL